MDGGRLRYRCDTTKKGDISKNTDTPYALDITGAEGRTRTVTRLPSLDFESSASTNSTTSARLNLEKIQLIFLKEAI